MDDPIRRRKPRVIPLTAFHCYPVAPDWARSYSRVREGGTEVGPHRFCAAYYRTQWEGNPADYSTGAVAFHDEEPT
jgi:hypothetical protein